MSTSLIQESEMNMIAKVLVLLSFGLLGTSAVAVGQTCPKWVCGANSPVIAGAQVGARTFIPAWGSNLNSPLVASGLAPWAPFQELVDEMVGGCQQFVGEVAKRY
jgi:hypothetical protein